MSGKSNRRKRRYWYVGRGWFGLRLVSPPSPYFVLRDIERHPPLFSERNGYRQWHRILRIGRWDLGWFS